MATAHASLVDKFAIARMEDRAACVIFDKDASTRCTDEAEAAIEASTHPASKQGDAWGQFDAKEEMIEAD